MKSILDLRTIISTINPYEIPNSHPNTAANQYVGPIFSQAIVEAFVSNPVPVTNTKVTGAGGVTTIMINNGTLQLSTEVSPSNAINKTVTWSITSGTGLASIDSTGLLYANANGVVTIRATAKDGTNIYDEFTVTITNQNITNVNNYRTLWININHNYSALNINLKNYGESLLFTLYNSYGLFCPQLCK